MSWTAVPPGTQGVALYTFTPDPQLQYQIQLDVGDIVEILEECGGWYRGYLSDRRKVSGIFPKNHIHLRNKSGSTVDPLVEEATETLRAWSRLLRKHLVNGAYKDFNKVRADLTYLLTSSQQLIAQNLSQDGLKKLRRDIINRIDQGNRAQNLDAVARNEEGLPLDDRNATFIELYRSYADSYTKAEAEKAAEVKAKESQQHHLYLDFKACIASLCGQGETSELFFSVYSLADKQAVSEEYTVVLTYNGMPKDEDKIGKLRTLFIDFTNSNLRDKMFLICKIVRNGRMVSTDKEKTFQCFRRPFGAAVLDISDVLTGRNKQLDAEFMMPILVSENEEEWHELPLKIMSNAGGFKSVSTAQGLAVALRMFHGEVGTVTKENSTLLKDIAVTPKLGFPDVILPGFMRNVLYLTLMTGDFQQGRKTSAKNIEVIVSVRGPNGDDLPNCISRANGETNVTEFESMIYYHNNSPNYMETIRLDVPIHLYDTSHVFIVFRHCSSSDTKEKSDKNFAFAFIPLVVEGEGTVVPDQVHVLSLYTYERKLVTNTSSYLKEADPKKMEKLKDTFTMKSTLCSTKLTQKSELLRLLRWKNSGQSQMSMILKQFTFIGDVEIIKFVQDIFDALFAILDSDKNVHEQLDGLVFSALIYIIEKITDKRFNNFRPVLNVYIDMHFSGNMTHRHLTQALRKTFDNASDIATKDDLMKSMKGMEYIFKFIVQSRFLQRNQDRRSPNAAATEEVFRQEILSLFKSAINFITNCPPALIGAQTIAMSNFPSIFKDLIKVVGPKELATFAKDFSESVKSQNKKVVATAKLQMIQGLVKSPLYENPEARGILTSSIIDQLNSNFNTDDTDSIGPSISILAEILGAMQKSDKPSQGILTVANLLPRLLQAYERILKEVKGDPKVDNDKKSQLGELTVDILMLLNLLTNDGFEAYLNDQATRGSSLETLIVQIMQVLNTCMREYSFPSTWSTLNLVQCKVVLKTIRSLKPVLAGNFKDKNFKTDIWTSFFALIQILLSAKSLQLETFSPSKEKSVLSTFGDMRGEAASILQTSWDELGAQQARFVPGVISPFVELTLLPHKGIRSSATTMLFSVIFKYYEQNKSMEAIENETMDAVDKAVADINVPIEDDYRTFFINEMLSKFDASKDAQFKTVGKRFVESLDQLLELRMNVRSLPEGAEYEDERTQGLLKLMQFVKRINRDATYIRYVHQLADSHVKANNMTEAAFTLCLHADLLTWSNQELPADYGFPAQTMSARKEALTLRIIDHMEKGKIWEAAVEKCKDLVKQYDEQLHDYKKLSALLQRQAQLYQSIATQERFFCEYFRVGYYGKGFPVTLQNKQFIYRGDELERISAFCERIQDKHPKADLLKTNAPPGDDILNSNGQYIQVVKVDPEPASNHPKLLPSLPEYIRKYYESNDVNRFSFSRPYKKQKTGNEFMDLWTQKTLLVTENRIPGLMRRNEVIETSMVELAPIENAIVSMSNKNRELVSFENKYTANRSLNSNPFTMALNGVVDAPVNGGVGMYRQSFFTEEYLKNNPTHDKFVVELRRLIDEQVLVVERCIQLHEKIVVESMRPLHEKIIENFDKNFAEELSRLLPNRVRVFTTPSIPTPVHPGSVEAQQAAAAAAAAANNKEDNLPPMGRTASIASRLGVSRPTLPDFNTSLNKGNLESGPSSAPIRQQQSPTATSLPQIQPPVSAPIANAAILQQQQQPQPPVPAIRRSMSKGDVTGGGLNLPPAPTSATPPVPALRRSPSKSDVTTETGPLSAPPTSAPSPFGSGQLPPRALPGVAAFSSAPPNIPPPILASRSVGVLPKPPPVPAGGFGGTPPPNTPPPTTPLVVAGKPPMAGAVPMIPAGGAPSPFKKPVLPPSGSFNK